MAANTTALLIGLRDYQASLERHMQSLEQEWHQLGARWQSFGSVYEGTAASQFHSHWAQTVSGFRDYLNATARISRLLGERIAALEEADRQGNL